MEKRTLGMTGLEVSPLCIGAWQLGGPLAFDGQPDGHPDPGRENVLRMIRALGDAGINCIDTAEQYSGGESECRVGAAIQGRREEWILSTKFGYRVGPGGTRNDSSSPHTIVPSIEGSLKRLGTDYIDVYLYHCAPDLDELDAGREVLETLVKQGKCRFYGISTNNVELIRAMRDREMLHVLQYHTNLLQPMPEIRELLERQNIGTQVRGVMAQGRLSGKYFHQQPTWAADDNRAKGSDDFRRYAAFEAVLPEGYTMSQAAIRWVLDDPRNHTICLGAKTLEDYKIAIRAITMPTLSPEARERLETCAAALA